MLPTTDDATLNVMLNDSGMPNRLTSDSIDNVISDVTFSVIDGTTTTVCAIQLVNGFVVTGTSACIDPINFDAELGTQLAFDNARQKIFELEAYLLSEKRYQAKQAFIRDELTAHEEYLAKAGQGIAERIAEFLERENIEDVSVTVSLEALEANKAMIPAGVDAETLAGFYSTPTSNRSGSEDYNQAAYAA